MHLAKRLLVLCCSLALLSGVAVANEKKIKAGFVYVGPVGAYGFTFGHDEGRLFAEKELLQRAAIIGRTFWDGLLSALTEDKMEIERINSLLEALREHAKAG